MKRLVIITARKGSRRLRNKNIKYLKGKRLFEHTLNFAIKNFVKKEILVTTDSKLIFDISKKKDVLCPWLRPHYLSSQFTSSHDVILHAVRWYEKNFHKLDYIILLQPTSPYRDSNTLRRCLNLFLKERDSTIKTIKVDNNKNHKNKILYFNNVSYPNGSFYVIPRNHIFSKKIEKNKMRYILIFNKKKI